MTRGLLLASLALMGVGLALGACGGGLALGQAAPDFELTDLTGRKLRLGDLKGRVVLVNFWGTWCEPCRLEAPELVALYDRLSGRPFELVAIAVGDERDDALRFAQIKGMRFPVALDSGQSRLYRVRAFPTSIVIDPAGRVSHVLQGYAPESIALMEGVIERILDSGGSQP